MHTGLRAGPLARFAWENGAMAGLGPLVAYNRETLMVAALWGLIVAGVTVSFGAWMLLWRGRGKGADPRADGEARAKKIRPEPSPSLPLGAPGEAPSPPASREGNP